MTAENEKLLKMGGVAAIAGTVLYFTFAKSKGGGNKPDPTGNDSDSGNGSAWVFDASAIAETLYDTMKEMGTDNNGTKILNVLTYVNAVQFVQVVGKFGKRSYNKTLGNQYNFWFGSLPKEPLKVWLANEMSDETYETLRRKYPNSL